MQICNTKIVSKLDHPPNVKGPKEPDFSLHNRHVTIQLHLALKPRDNFLWQTYLPFMLNDLSDPEGKCLGLLGPSPPHSVGNLVSRMLGSS